MTVAIVLRTRDRPVLLARALASILAQTHQDWHLVLVNDGAPAPVDALASTYATAFGDRLSLLHAARPLGPDQAAELGIAHDATRLAGFVALHDDDDAWHPDFLRASLAFLGDGDDVAVASQGWLVEERMEEGGVVEERRREDFSKPHPLDLADLLADGQVPLICLLLRRTVLDRMRAAADRPLEYGAGFATALLLEGEVGVIPRRLGFSYRRDTRTGAYANRSEPDDAAERTRHRNRLLRALVAADPALLGLGPAIAAALAPEFAAIRERIDRNGGWGHGRHGDLQSRLIRIETAVEALQQSAGTILRPMQRAWHALGPPRRLLARLRGRI